MTATQIALSITLTGCLISGCAVMPPLRASDGTMMVPDPDERGYILRVPGKPETHCASDYERELIVCDDGTASSVEVFVDPARFQFAGRQFTPAD